MSGVDVQSRRTPAQSITPAAYTAAVNGNGINVAAHAGSMAVLNIGTVTDGNWTPALEESDDNSIWAAVAAEDQQGAFTLFTSAESNTVQKVGYKNNKRFVRVVLTETGASTGAIFGAVVDLAKPGLVGDLVTVGVTPTGNETPPNPPA